MEAFSIILRSFLKRGPYSSFTLQITRLALQKQLWEVQSRHIFIQIPLNSLVYLH